MTFGIWLAVVAGVTRPSPDSVLAVRRDIEAQYANRARAVEAHRLRGILDVLAPGFTIRFLDGKILGRKEWEDGLRAQLASLDEQGRRAKESGGAYKNPERVSTVIKSITVRGDRASVAEVTDTVNTATYPRGLAFRATLEETSDDTWIKTALGWRLLTIEQVRTRTTTDESRARPATKR